MSRTRRTAACLLAALLLAGCGSGGHGDPVIASANAICESTVAEIRAQPATAAGIARSSTLVARELRRLRALSPSEPRRALYRRFLDAESTVVRSYATLAAAEHRHEPDAAMDVAALARAAGAAVAPARRYGLSGCTGAGATVGSPSP